MRAMRALTEVNVPRRMACLVMIPNQVSIWFIQLDPTGVKWSCTFGLRSSQACTSEVVWVDRLSSTTWICSAGVWFDRPFKEGQERRAGASRVAVGDHLAGGDIEGGEQVRDAVPAVV